MSEVRFERMAPAEAATKTIESINSMIQKATG